MFSFLNKLNKSNSNETAKVPTLINKPYRPWDLGEISLLMLLIIGTVGNVLSIAVMKGRRMKKNNVSLLVICIAVSDIALLTLKFLANMIKIYRIEVYNMCILMQVVPQAAMFISIWLIVLTSFERTVAVLSPLTVTIIFSKKRCHLIILLIIIFFILLSGSTSFCIRYSPTQPYYCQIKGGLNGGCFVYYSYVFPWLKSVFASWLPSILVTVFNVLIVHSLYRASKFRRNISTRYSLDKLNLKNTIVNDRYQLKQIKSISHALSTQKCSLTNKQVESSKLVDEKNNTEQLTPPKMRSRSPSFKIQNCKDRQITLMLLSISIVFILLTYPYAIYELLRKFGLNFKIFRNRSVQRALLFLVDLNHATNFIFYCLTAQRFRNELKDIICNNLYRKHSANLKSNLSNSYYSLLINVNNQHQIKKDTHF